MKLEIICLLYNASKFILQLHQNLLNQKQVNIIKINYVLTESDDNTENILIEYKIPYIKIKKQEFSHSLSRENALMKVSTKYAIMITQDIKIIDELTLYKMLNFSFDNNLALSYIRQVSNIGVDKYYRMISYGKDSKIHIKDDLDTVGIDACFCSDACACYNIDIFKKIKGFDNKNFITNEDMYYAYKCLILGYKVGYFANSYIIHHHNFSIKELYLRYKKIGIFLNDNPNIAKLKSSKIKYVKVLLYIITDLNLRALIRFPFDLLARYYGLLIGQKKGK